MYITSAHVSSLMVNICYNAVLQEMFIEALEVIQTNFQKLNY